MGCLGAILLLAGCATTNPRTAIPLTGDIQSDGPIMIASGPAQDRVLWQYRLAAADMRLGKFDEARRLLDDALLTAGGISTDEGARLARSYFHSESSKRFIGEPYERVMAYYYRGILYWMDGEPDNARACFRSAAIQDASVEGETYTADYVLLDYLDGLASVKLGGDGSDAFGRAAAKARGTKPPAYDPDANVLFFLEFNPGPYKYSGGEYGERLFFGSPAAPARWVEISVAGQRVRAGPYDDLCYQATTRGGRVMDHILKNKAVFKGSTSAAGDIAILGGGIAALHTDGTAQQVGLGLLAAGLISKVISAKTTPSADIRAWDNLPRYLSFACLRLDPGAHVATVQFRDAAGAVLPDLTKSLVLHISADGKDKVVFVSDRSTTPQTL